MKKLLNLRTALFVALSMISGITFTYFVYSEMVFYSLLTLVVFLGLVALYITLCVKDGKRLKGLILSSLFLIVAILGGSYVTFKFENYLNADLGNHYSSVTGRVVSVVEQGDYTVAVLSNVEIGYPEDIESKYKVRVIIDGNVQLEIGDIINYEQNLIDLGIVSNGKISVYDLGNGIKYLSYLSQDEYQIIDNQKTIFERVNVFIKDTAESGLDQKEFSVVYALLTGNADYMEDRLITNFRASGVAHIFAVSGLHIGFLSMALSFILDKLKTNKIVKAILIILSLIFYSGVCGFSASSLRATVMCSVSLIAGIFGEKYDGVSAMGVALFLVLLLNPFQLFFAGFQLSFGVVFAILIMANSIAKLFKKIKKLPEKWAFSLGSVISAQLASMPIMIIHFGTLSLCSVMVNLLFIPAVSFIFIFSLASVILAGIVGVSHLLLPLNYLMKGVIFIIDGIDFTVFLVSGLTIGASVIFYYLGLLVLSGFVNVKGKLKKITALSMFSIFVLTGSIGSLVEHNSFKIYATSSYSLCASMIDYKGNSTLIVNYSRGSVNTSSLKSIADSKNITKIDHLIVLDNQADIPQLLTKIFSFCKVNNVYYYGNKDKSLEQVIEKSFKETSVNNFNEKIEVKLPFAYEILLDGKAFEIEHKNKKALFVSQLRNLSNSIYQLKREVEIVFAVDLVENVFSMVESEREYSYFTQAEFESVKNRGNIVYYLK
ncbi:MAG: ComEC/Rec2 family competence protein [Clostridia bacterium]|nr:ComEC/Rec2 family competence protein [Clostridia bacterium]